MFLFLILKLYICSVCVEEQDGGVQLQTALHVAVKSGSVELVFFLLHHLGACESTVPESLWSKEIAARARHTAFIFRHVRLAMSEILLIVTFHRHQGMRVCYSSLKWTTSTLKSACRSMCRKRYWAQNCRISLGATMELVPQYEETRSTKETPATNPRQVMLSDWVSYTPNQT